MQFLDVPQKTFSAVKAIVMNRQFAFTAGSFVAVVAVTASLYFSERARWHEQFALGTINVAGARRLDLMDTQGKQFFGEYTNKTDIREGSKKIEPSQIPVSAHVMVLGTHLSLERMQADVIRVIPNIAH